MKKLTKTQLVSAITCVISGVAFFVGDVGNIWGFSGIGGQIKDTLASFSVASGMVLGANTIFKSKETETETKEEKSK